MSSITKEDLARVIREQVQMTIEDMGLTQPQRVHVIPGAEEPPQRSARHGVAPQCDRSVHRDSARAKRSSAHQRGGPAHAGPSAVVRSDGASANAGRRRPFRQ